MNEALVDIFFVITYNIRIVLCFPRVVFLLCDKMKCDLAIEVTLSVVYVCSLACTVIAILPSSLHLLWRPSLTCFRYALVCTQSANHIMLLHECMNVVLDKVVEHQ